MGDRIYLDGYENYFALYDDANQRIKGRSLRVFVYYCVLCLINKHRKITAKDIYVINGNTIRRNKSCPEYNGKTHVYSSDFFNTGSELREFITFVSPIGRVKRTGVFLHVIKECLKHREYNFASYLDYCFLSCFLEKVRPDRIVSRSHYDMMATWLGGLTEKYHYHYSIYQHGIVSAAIHIPHKFHCDEFFGFDQYSLNVFKNNYISNDDCTYQAYHFISSVKFEDIEKEKNKIYIGLIEQNRRDWIETILNTLQSERYYFVIMKHPSSVQHYSDLGDNVTETDRKYGNLDAVITCNSTLILDYYRSGYTGEIYFTSDEFRDTFSDYKNIHYLDLTELRSEMEKNFPEV